MAKKPEMKFAPKELKDDWKQSEGKLASSALLNVLNELTGRQRRAYSLEWERHEALAEILMSSSPEVRKLIESIGEIRTVDHLVAGRYNDLTGDHVLDQQMDIRNGMSTDRLSFRIGPFDVIWTDFQPSGARGTAAHGPSADLNGHMALDLTETYVDRPVAYGGWMRNAAGIGSWFKPKSKSTYVRVAPFTPYEYRWKDDSSLQVAHNSGAISVMVQRFISPGNFETILDSRKPLWSDGTGWYETHQDEQSGYFVDSNYFWASSDDWYLVWVWCNSSIDFATKTTFGSSKADNDLRASLRWLVFEQWT